MTSPDDVTAWLETLATAKAATFPRQPWTGGLLEVTTVTDFYAGTAPTVMALFGMPKEAK